MQYVVKFSKLRFPSMVEGDSLDDVLGVLFGDWERYDVEFLAEVGSGKVVFSVNDEYPEGSKVFPVHTVRLQRTHGECPSNLMQVEVTESVTFHQGDNFVDTSTYTPSEWKGTRVEWKQDTLSTEWRKEPLRYPKEHNHYWG